VPPATGFRDKIAKFERKGGVPVPRGRFGLGAPPTSEGPRRQGELYGNRIPAPTRAVSGSMLPVLSRATSPTSTLGPNTPPGYSSGDRRSFSLSSVISDLDDGMDYTPIASPTFAFPPDSPESILSVSFTPETSPSLTSNGDVASFNKTIVRGTSFQKALEIARNAESAKQESQQAQQQQTEDAATPTARQRSLDNEEEVVGATKPTSPAILVSSEEPAPVVVLHNSPTVDLPPSELVVTTPTAQQRSPDNEEEAVGTTKPTPPAILLSSEEPVPVVVLHNSPTVDLPPFDLVVTPISTPSAASSSKASSVHEPEPEPVEVKEEIARREEPPATELPTVERVPLITEESIPTESVLEIEENEVPEFDEPIVQTPSPAIIEDVKAEEIPIPFSEPSTAPEPIAPTITISATPPVQAAKPLPEPPNVVVVEEKVVVAATPNIPLPEIVETASEPAKQHATPKVRPLPELPPPSIVVQTASEPAKQHDTPKVQPLPELPPPSIVVHDDQISTYDLNSGQAHVSNKRSEISLRKAALTLDPEPLSNNSLMSPPAVSGSMSAMSLTDVLTGYFTRGTNGEQSFRSTTPPPALPSASPLSPMATLAYDAPDTPPPRPAKVTPPDPQSFLSPPATGFLSAAPSSGNSSMGSGSSLGSRPMSMIEMSPSRVARATKMTPATSRGVPMFLPPNTSGARKSDFVYFPPTPDAEETDFGSAVLHKPSRSMTDLAEISGKESNTFTAVVHGKVREAQKPQRVPETPHKVKRSTILETPLSPGQGELAALLQGALWLEDSLDRGELPSDTPVEDVEEERLREEEARRAAAEAEAKAQEEEKKKIAIAKAQLQAKRDEPTSGRLKHTFLIPLTKARSVHHRKEVSSSKAESFPSKPRDDSALHPKSAGLRDRSGAGNAKAESATGSATQLGHPRATTPESKNTTNPTGTPPKSAKLSRFSSFRRLGSISRPSTVYGHPTRHSESVSSEDSVPVVTPPENNLEFGTKKSSSPVNEFGQIPENGSTTSFPSISPKKSIHSLGRATSFAERIWSRARTKSSGSNLSATSENAPGVYLFVKVTDAVDVNLFYIFAEEPPKLPSLSSPPAIEISQLPNFLSNEEPILHQPPQRSTSLNQRPTQSFEPLPLPPIITTTSSQTQVPTQSTPLSPHSLLLPGSSDSTRPSSFTSLSSAGSLPSPLFDKSIFDAFPSVPGTTPTPSFAATLHRRDKSVPMTASAATNSFDSALLSSAIHLVASGKRSTDSSAHNHMPSSRESTPTPMGRRSGENTR
jgi:hypothetical protein